VGVAASRGLGSDPSARASHSQARLAVKSINVIPYVSCFVAGGSCSLTPCSEFTGPRSVEGAVSYSTPPAHRSQPRAPTTRCAAYPRVGPRRPVFIRG
jgi:hypothetical protein